MNIEAELHPELYRDRLHVVRKDSTLEPRSPYPLALAEDGAEFDCEVQRVAPLHTHSNSGVDRPQAPYLSPGPTADEIAYAKPGMFWTLFDFAAFIASLCLLGVFVVFIVAIFSDAVAQGIYTFLDHLWGITR